MHRRFHFFAHQARKFRHRIELFDLLDQVEEDLFLAIGFAEESPINPIGELPPELQAQSGARNEQKQKRIAGQDRGERKVAIGDYRPDQSAKRERKDQTQHLLGKQILQAATNDDLNIKDTMFEDRISYADRDRHRHEITNHE